MDQKQNKYLFIISITVLLGSMMSTINTSSVNVAIPYMRGYLGASIEEITWVSTGFILARIIIMPIIPLISKWVGRKNFYLFSVATFTLSSLIYIYADNLIIVVILRIFQGIGAGALIPIAQSVLRESFPSNKQGLAMSIFGMGTIIGPAVGPVIGGYMVEYFNWKWVFYINIPFGIIATFLVYKFIEDPPYIKRERSYIDIPGLIFMTIGFSALQIMLAEGEHEDWFSSNYIKTLFVIAIIGIITFIIRELMTKKPAVDLKLFRNFMLSIGTFISSMLQMALLSVLFVIPLFLQELLDYPPITTGVALMPRAISMILVMYLAGAYYEKIGPRIIIATGLMFSALGFYQLSRMNLYVDFWGIFWPQFIQGIGFGLLFVSLSTIALSKVKGSDIQAASGLYNLGRQIAGSIGIAVFATLADRGVNHYRAMIVHNVNLYNIHTTNWLDTVKDGIEHANVINIPNCSTVKLLEGEINRQAAMLGYNHIFAILSYIFVFLLILVPFIPSKKDL
ncbi:MAG: DHA2 family efflux MFS transporter permease subunit [Deferribacterota bacterium]|nr:DHA2 family efflux MFS transporter permease subunit [Deferribacterota bacterium]